MVGETHTAPFPRKQICEMQKTASSEVLPRSFLPIHYKIFALPHTLSLSFTRGFALSALC